MPSERVQRQIDRLLDDAEAALAESQWSTVAEKSRAVLAIDEGNEDAAAYLKMAEANLGGASVASPPAPSLDAAPPASSSPPRSHHRPAPGPETFANGRYEVLKFLGEGGRKKVYLAKDSLLDRQVAFALIKTEGLDEAARERITREAQTMGRLGNHPNLVSVLDIGEHTDASGVTFPWMAIELLPGGDVEGLLKKAGGALPVERTLQLALDTCRGLEFLHGKGVIHRDLKPGNVWLTADGVAKIGDYGLAMSVDRTRLTLQGTMVGTVDYMPPEQALGGEMTPRSDLYSLGAMLYELVTGAPPFKGDRLTEVISQHINVVPEPPSVRGAQIPVALDELIVQLLAKDPAKRPATAREVRERLEAIDPTKLPVVFDEEFRLRRARQVFVGRTRELEELRSRFDEAAGGQSRIVMLVGQPGIGKTRLAQELEVHARSRGGRVLWGRAPEGGGAPPYWLFTQALRRFLDEVDETSARRLLGEDAEQLSRIAPEIHERLRTSPPADSSEFALLEAVRTFLHRLAEDRPLLLVLDDLHWADQGSLSLLQHASRDLARAPVLILGTYRDTELTRTHPLSQALATLNREPNFSRLSIRGLDRAQVSDYIQRSAGFEPTREQLDAFMRETAGNAFFLTEIVSGMLGRGTFDDRTVKFEIPDGMREALARRVNALSEDAVDLLKLAAVIGYEFDFATLSVVSEQSADRELELVEEALRENVIAESERPGAYRFAYQPMQRLLLEELSATRRMRLHGQIGEQLEASYGNQAEQHARLLAPHFTESLTLTPAHREKALRYCWHAGQQAEAAEEISAAADFYDQALGLVRGGVELRGVDEADVMAAWGHCALETSGSEAALEAIRGAVDRFIRSGRGKAAAEAAMLLDSAGVRSVDAPEGAFDQALAALGDSEPALRASLLSRRALRSYDEGGDRDAEQARQLAGALRLPDVEARLLLRDAAIAHDAGDHARAIALAEDAEARFHALGRASDVAQAQDIIYFSHLHGGTITELERMLRRVSSELQPGASLRREAVISRLAMVLLLRCDPELNDHFSRPLPPGNQVDSHLPAAQCRDRWRPRSRVAADRGRRSGSAPSYRMTA